MDGEQEPPRNPSAATLPHEASSPALAASLGGTAVPSFLLDDSDAPTEPPLGMAHISICAKDPDAPIIPKVYRVEDNKASCYKPLRKEELWSGRDEDIIAREQYKPQAAVGRRKHVPFVPAPAVKLDLDPYANLTLSYLKPVENLIERRAFDVSTAEVVESSIIPAQSMEAPLAKANILAYDDGDPFCFKVHRLPSPPHVPEGDLTFNDVELFSTNEHIVLLAMQRSYVFWISTETMSLGWRRARLDSPPPTSVPLIARSGPVLFGPSKLRMVMLDLTEYHPAWETRKVWDGVNRNWEPNWLHTIDDSTLYVRDATSHTLFVWEGVGVGNGESRQVREVCLRGCPNEEPLDPIRTQHGFALLYQPTHTWLYRFEMKARKFLPLVRLECARPIATGLEGRLYFFSEDPPGSHSLRVTHKVEVKNGALTTVPRQGDVVIVYDPQEIAAFCPSSSFCVTVLSKDLESYVKVEVDRWNRVRGFLRDAPDSTNDNNKQAKAEDHTEGTPPPSPTDSDVEP